MLGIVWIEKKKPEAEKWTNISRTVQTGHISDVHSDVYNGYCCNFHWH